MKVPIDQARDAHGVGATTNRVVTVLVVDDQEPFRAAMRDLLTSCDGFQLIGEAASGEAAIHAAAELSPRMVLMDMRMSGMGGVEAAKALANRDPAPLVVLVSVEEPDAATLRSCGAAAFIDKQRLSRRQLQETWSRHGS